jgi:hypothetical protein
MDVRYLKPVRRGIEMMKEGDLLFPPFENHMGDGIEYKKIDELNKLFPKNNKILKIVAIYKQIGWGTSYNGVSEAECLVIDVYGNFAIFKCTMTQTQRYSDGDFNYKFFDAFINRYIVRKVNIKTRLLNESEIFYINKILNDTSMRNININNDGGASLELNELLFEYVLFRTITPDIVNYDMFIDMLRKPVDYSMNVKFERMKEELLEYKNKCTKHEEELLEYKNKCTKHEEDILEYKNKCTKYEEDKNECAKLEEENLFLKNKFVELEEQKNNCENLLKKDDLMFNKALKNYDLLKNEYLMYKDDQDDKYEFLLSRYTDMYLKCKTYLPDLEL